jgi:hypothetical protein
MPPPLSRWRRLCRRFAIATATPMPPPLPRRRCCVPAITFAALTPPPLPRRPCHRCCCTDAAVAVPPCNPALAASLWVGPAGPRKKLSGPGPGPRCEGRLLLALALALKGPVRVGPRAGRARPGPRTVYPWRPRLSTTLHLRLCRHCTPHYCTSKEGGEVRLDR